MPTVAAWAPPPVIEFTERMDIVVRQVGGNGFRVRLNDVLVFATRNRLVENSRCVEVADVKLVDIEVAAFDRLPRRLFFAGITALRSTLD